MKRATKRRRRSRQATKGAEASTRFSSPSSLRRFVASSLFLLTLVPTLHAEISVKGIALAEEGRGASYGSEVCHKQLDAIKEIGGKWVAISPVAGVRGGEEPHVTLCRGGGWGGEKMGACLAGPPGRQEQGL